MKKQIFTLFLLLNSLLLFAQNEIPEYGKIDMSDMLLKDCAFDKDACAYKLLSLGDVNYEMANGNFNIVNYRRVRIKILNNEGLKKAHTTIQFYNSSGYKAVKDITGITYNLDNTGNIITTTMSKDSIKSKKINNKLAEVSFNMPDVKVGSVIEYEYSYVDKSIGNIEDWYFQDDIPTRFSLYNVAIPYMFKFETTVYAYQEIEQENSVINQNATFRRDKLAYASSVKSYILRDVAALKKEPFMGSAKDYMQRIAFRLTQVEYGNGEKEEVNSEWPKVTKDLLSDPDFGIQLKKKLNRTKRLDDSLLNASDDYNKMAIIYEYVRKNIKWNGDESVFASRDVIVSWEKKSGNTADLNFALIILLKDAGLQAYPLLVSTNENGVIDTHNPLLRQFNVTMACVIIDGRKYILNAADKYNSPNLLPSNVINNNGFIVDTEIAGFIPLTTGNTISRNVVAVVAMITPDDTLRGSASIKSYDYAKDMEVKRLRGEKDTLETFYTKSYDGMKINCSDFTNLEMDSVALQQEFDFSMPLTIDGNNKTFTLNLFQGFDKNPFEAEKRNTDIDFNYKRFYTIEGHIYIPDNYHFKEIPKNVKINMSDSGITMERLIKKEKNSLEFSITMEINNTFYQYKSYPILHDFYNRLYSALAEQIVLERKNKVK